MINKWAFWATYRVAQNSMTARIVLTTAAKTQAKRETIKWAFWAAYCGLTSLGRPCGPVCLGCANMTATNMELSWRTAEGSFQHSFRRPPCKQRRLPHG